ncbi:hypothetical protein Tco_0775001 [Tanacetum coccineum]
MGNSVEIRTKLWIFSQNAHPIKYALMINPTIYTLCIEQFWATANVKTVTGEVQIQALVDKKKVIVTEASTSQAVEITELKKRVKKLEGKRKPKPRGIKRLFKIGRSAQVVSSEDDDLGDQEDASKQGRKIAAIDADTEVTLVDETQGKNDEEMFDTCILDGEEVIVNTFVDMDTELVKGSETRTEESSKRAGEELESENLKKQKLDENVEAEVDDEAEMKKHMEIVPDDAFGLQLMLLPLATKLHHSIDWKIHQIGKEDLETLWKLVKAKHGNTRLEEAYERVLWGDLKVMFEPDIESDVWRNLQGHKVTVWKLFSSSGVHFVRFQNLHIFMLVEKKYPLTPTTITKMLNKKLQTDHWNEMYYQLLKLMTKRVKNPGSV